MPTTVMTEAPLRPFNLSRWFAIVGLLSVSTISALAAWGMTRIVTDLMLRQEGQLTQEFVQTLVLTEPSLQSYFVSGTATKLPELDAALSHLTNMADMLRVNLYNRERRLIWSSDRSLTGEQFGSNDELDEALAGELVVHPEIQETHGGSKPEHRNIGQSELFVEIYVPIRGGSEAGSGGGSGTGRIIGVIEFYKNPQKLFWALSALRTYIAIGAALASLVRRGDLLLRAQERRLIDAETLATIGEMSSAVAHGIRNPLASIRSSAELAMEADADTAREAAADIVLESDRLEAWVRELLSYSRPLDDAPNTVELPPVIARCADEFERDFERLAIRVSRQIERTLPAVRGNALLLGQVLHGIIANAVEAIQHDGNIQLIAVSGPASNEVSLRVCDSGPGMDEAQLARVGKPFYTTKPLGLGVGLAMARRIVERFGGRLEIHSAPGQGTEVNLILRRA